MTNADDEVFTGDYNQYLQWLTDEELPVGEYTITLADLFSNFSNFVIPLMIVALITKGIAELTEGAGKLLGVTFLSAYASTLVAVGIA